MTSAAAKITLTYPLYACDFDPQDQDRLIVGGGGGAGRSGVGNKITILDTSSPEELETSDEIELSRDEDNVTSLAAGQRKGKSTLLFAGVNSSPEEQKKGNNQHFRIFGADLPSSKSKTGKISELSRTALFSEKDADAYQRITRVSAPFPGYMQVGAAATGLAKQAQIALFDVAPGGTVPKPRIRLNLDSEANDVDVIQVSEEQYRLVYCNDYEIYMLNISKSGASDGEPQLIFTTPHDTATGGARPIFRAMRFLTPNFLVAVCNMPKRTGVVLQAYRLPAAPSTASTEAGAPARVSIQTKLPKHVAQSTALAAVNLHPPTAPGASAGDTQFVIAVAGADFSISLFTLEHASVMGIEVLSKLYPLTTVRDVHPHAISGLSFSHFYPPVPTSAGLITSSTSPPKSTKSARSASAATTPAAPSSSARRPPVVKLASVSVANTAVVHTIPLKKLATPGSEKVATSTKGARRASNPIKPKQPPRYVVAAASKAPSPRTVFTVFGVGVLLLAIILQSFLEIRNFTDKPILGARKYAPASWVHTPPKWGAHLAAGKGSSEARPLLQRLAEADGPVVLREGAGESGIEFAPHVVVAGDAGGSNQVNGEADASSFKEGGSPVAWEELPIAQRTAWKEKLKAAGHWGEEMGEAIFKGVLFSQLGGVVGDFVRRA
ncbi:hypothetical protein MCOR27_002507 [Pyricularia oryzae]|uniref:Guanine nucleotide-exchange factor SEC12 n=1 Tax=Pyricularia grisea TaxID=148305 RepID=A0ABQ8NB65_PYRGI|nr:hypothetical protein MCOR01_001292 [Pyricularia oryzae]KAI6294240.1 hypothetical protein MCOR33_008580 [Pyricularia grisea]KAH9430161.1 hypothetical protein MCOR02_009884 [Pyricularia oryzae]KAI6263297.1 hypothetical protein MCOR19_000423 [Pyricularia oryzae]KAI6277105.1 hypothetical protein MCOR26_005307 [Pyricularia oryzae]